MPVTSSGAGAGFIETRQHRRSREFCDACRRDQYIGLCYGPPGVGKTLSARHYANWDTIERYRPDAPNGAVTLDQVRGSAFVFYTPPVVVTSPTGSRITSSGCAHCSASSQRTGLANALELGNIIIIHASKTINALLLPY
jgi:hypothetical protein